MAGWRGGFRGVGMRWGRGFSRWWGGGRKIRVLFLAMMSFVRRFFLA